MTPHLITDIVFVIMVIALLALDLFIVGKKSHKISMKEAGIWTVIFILAACAFGGFVYYELGKQPAVEYFSAYVIEKTLSVDNLFVFILVFSYFKVPEEYHHKVLFWGVMGAIIMRFIFIFLGVELIEYASVSIKGVEINVVLLLFGLFLLYAGIKAGIEVLNDGGDEDEDYSKSPGAKFVKWIFPRVTDNYEGDKFFVKKEESVTIMGDRVYDQDNGGYSQKTFIGKRLVRYATPLLVVVGVVEFTDLLFAVDSIPAIFSVSKDPFILYSSNIFAILGLRSMYFLLAGLLPMFKYLNHGLAIILTFIGVKMVIAPLYHFNPTVSLYIVLGILTLSVIVSLLTYKKAK